MKPFLSVTHDTVMFMSYRYSNLTGAIADKASPLRQYLDQRYPNLKPVQADCRADAGELLVDGGGASSGTLSTKHAGAQ